MRKIVVIAHNIRSTHNIGSLFRTCDGFGVSKLYLTGYSPHPLAVNEERLPHLAAKITRQIQKTALGAEKTTRWHYNPDIYPILQNLRHDDYEIIALEQADNSIELQKFHPPEKIAVIIGNEIDGVDKKILKNVSKIIEIPMYGKKESFNVAAATAIALYHFRTAEVV